MWCFSYPSCLYYLLHNLETLISIKDIKFLQGNITRLKWSDHLNANWQCLLWSATYDANPDVNTACPVQRSLSFISVFSSGETNKKWKRKLPVKAHQNSLLQSPLHLYETPIPLRKLQRFDIRDFDHVHRLFKSSRINACAFLLNRDE